MTTKEIIIYSVGVLILLFLIGYALPFLISSKSTELVLFGFVVAFTLVVGCLIKINNLFKQEKK